MEFVETGQFSRLLPRYLDEDGYLRLRRTLASRPDAGRVIPGLAGIRKLRWVDRRRGKGKRGGLRVIYALVRANRILMLALYDKGEAVDLTPGLRRHVLAAVEHERRHGPASGRE